MKVHQDCWRYGDTLVEGAVFVTARTATPWMVTEEAMRALLKEDMLGGFNQGLSA